MIADGAHRCQGFHTELMAYSGRSCRSKSNSGSVVTGRLAIGSIPYSITANRTVPCRPTNRRSRSVGNLSTDTVSNGVSISNLLISRSPVNRTKIERSWIRRPAGRVGGRTVAEASGRNAPQNRHRGRCASILKADMRLSEPEYRMLGRILQSAVDQRLYAMTAEIIRQIARTGCRRMEIIALASEEADVDGSCLTPHRQQGRQVGQAISQGQFPLGVNPH